MARPETLPVAEHANEHASVPESTPNHRLPQAALDHMNESSSRLSILSTTGRASQPIGHRLRPHTGRCARAAGRCITPTGS